MDPHGTKIPLYALIATIAFVISAVLLVIFAPPENQGAITLIGLFVSTLPSLVAAFASERASRDIRNGVVEYKAKTGALQALDETGVTSAVQEGQTTTATALTALTKILENQSVSNAPLTKEVGTNNG